MKSFTFCLYRILFFATSFVLGITSLGLGQGAVSGSVSQSNAGQISSPSSGSSLLFTNLAAPSKEVQGSRMLYDVWLKGSVLPKGAQKENTINNLKLKLDLVNHRLMFIDEGHTDSLLAENSAIGAVTFITPKGPETYVFLKNPEVESYSPLDFKVHKSYYDGKFKVMESYSKIKQSTTIAVLGNSPEPPRFVLMVKPYLFTPDGTIVKITSKKQVLPFFKDKQNQAETFIAEKKLSMRKIQDWATLAAYIDALP